MIVTGVDFSSPRGMRERGVAQAGDERVEADARRVGQYKEGEPIRSPQDLANRLLVTVYMGTSAPPHEYRNNVFKP